MHINSNAIGKVDKLLQEFEWVDDLVKAYEQYQAEPKIPVISTGGDEPGIISKTIDAVSPGGNYYNTGKAAATAAGLGAGIYGANRLAKKLK
jgi:hypothetical protein